MDETVAQAAPNNGASNAEDFQPTTQNPQNRVSDVQQQGGLESATNPQEFLNENRTTELTVAAEPAPATAQANTSNITTLVLISAIAVVVAILLFKISNRMPAQKKAETASSKAHEPTETKTAEKKSSKVASKRKPKKTKRRNR